MKRLYFIVALSAAGVLWRGSIKPEVHHERQAGMKEDGVSVETRIPTSLAYAVQTSSTAGLSAQILSRLRRWVAAEDADVRSQIEAELETFLTDDTSADILQALPKEFLQTPFARNAISRWSQRNPAAVLDWMSAQGVQSNDELGIAVHCWLERDNAALREYILRVPDGEWKQQLLNVSACEALGNGLPANAVAWLIQVSPENRNPNLLDSAIQLWARTDFSAAMAWVGLEADEDLRNGLLANIAIGMAGNDAKAAIEFAREHLQTQGAVTQATQGIASAWARRDPAAAASWIALFPAGEARSEALQLVLLSWSNADWTAAQNWIVNQLDGPERDRSLLQVANWQSHFDSAVAACIVTQMSPGIARDEMFSGLMRRWGRDDLSGAREWTGLLPAGTFRQQAVAALQQAANDLERGSYAY